MAKVKCIKSVTIGALDMTFIAGEEYDIPAKDASSYSEYFEKKAGTKTKKAETAENKESATEEDK